MRHPENPQNPQENPQDSPQQLGSLLRNLLTSDDETDTKKILQSITITSWKNIESEEYQGSTSDLVLSIEADVDDLFQKLAVGESEYRSVVRKIDNLLNVEFLDADNNQHIKAYENMFLLAISDETSNKLSKVAVNWFDRLVILNSMATNENTDDETRQRLGSIYENILGMRGAFEVQFQSIFSDDENLIYDEHIGLDMSVEKMRESLSLRLWGVILFDLLGNDNLRKDFIQVNPEILDVLEALKQDLGADYKPFYLEKRMGIQDQDIKNLLKLIKRLNGDDTLQLDNLNQFIKDIPGLIPQHIAQESPHTLRDLMEGNSLDPLLTLFRENISRPSHKDVERVQSALKIFSKYEEVIRRRWKSENLSEIGQLSGLSLGIADVVYIGNGIFNRHLVSDEEIDSEAFTFFLKERFRMEYIVKKKMLDRPVGIQREIRNYVRYIYDDRATHSRTIESMNSQVMRLIKIFEVYIRYPKRLAEINESIQNAIITQNKDLVPIDIRQQLDKVDFLQRVNVEEDSLDLLVEELIPDLRPDSCQQDEFFEFPNFLKSAYQYVMKFGK